MQTVGWNYNTGNFRDKKYLNKYCMCSNFANGRLNFVDLFLQVTVEKVLCSQTSFSSLPNWVRVLGNFYKSHLTDLFMYRYNIQAPSKPLGDKLSGSTPSPPNVEI